MTAFQYHDGILFAEDVPLPEIAAAVGTPCYVYSTAGLTANYRAFADALVGLDALVCFAMKANGNLAVLRTLADLGAGADVVSGGELLAALHAGIPASKIVFAGVGKTRDELAVALEHGILQINVESASELLLLDEVATSMGRVAPVALRVNPDVEPNTHAKISTGYEGTKFGIAWVDALPLYHQAASLPGIAPTGIAVHIGSQITTLQPFHDAFQKVAGLVKELRGKGINIQRIDFGGGIGIRYDNENPPPIADYVAMVKKVADPLGVTCIFEPGRWLVGNTGLLLTRVIHLKDVPNKRFAIVDAGMNDFMRTALYEARHRIIPVHPTAQTAPFSVVGPVCETTCIFGDGYSLPEGLQRDDLLAILDTGAYGAVLASTYNMRSMPPEIMVNGDRFATVQRRLGINEVLGLSVLPPWMN